MELAATAGNEHRETAEAEAAREADTGEAGILLNKTAYL